MASHGYNLYLLPAEATFRPNPAQIGKLLKYLAERLEIPGEFTVDGEEELTLESALEQLRAAVQSAHGGTECIVSFNDLVSGSLFGYDQEAPDPDDAFWADELRLYVTSAPFPYADWDYEEAACPACNQRFTQIHDVLEEIRLSGSPVACPCGAKTAPEDLKKSPGVHLSQLAIVFAGNRGWHYEVKRDADTIVDPEFLPALEQILGVKVDVVVVGH
jgi:hypothetical protein